MLRVVHSPMLKRMLSLDAAVQTDGAEPFLDEIRAAFAERLAIAGSVPP